MSFIDTANNWLSSNQTYFEILLFGTLACMLVLFCIVFVHVLRGVKFAFVIILNVAVLQSILCYMMYSY